MATDREFLNSAGLTRVVLWVPAEDDTVQYYANVVKAQHLIRIVKENLVPDWLLEQMALKRRYKKLPETGELLGMRGEALELSNKQLTELIDKTKEAVEEHHKQRYDAANENTPYEDSLVSGALSYGYYLLALAYYEQVETLLEKAKDK